MSKESQSDNSTAGFDKSVWVFNASNKGLPGGIFENLNLAEKWISKNRLTGTLTRYPVNQGTLDWAIQNNMVNMKPEKLKAKVEDPDFIGDFTTASMEHYHYENGCKD
jgi:hypothetical protein